MIMSLLSVVQDYLNFCDVGILTSLYDHIIIKL